MIRAEETPHRRSTRGADVRNTDTLCGGTLLAVLAMTAAGITGAVSATIGGPVWAPLTAAAAAFASGAAIASVYWHGWTRARVDRALRDPLTSLPNRTAIEDRLDAANRSGSPVTVALADVDGLHAINANFGHAAGDQYLAAVARRLARAVPPGGLLVRQSGDEFTLLVPGADADAVATAIGAAMAGPALIAGHRIQPRASVGIATSDGGPRHDAHHDARHARARADVAMFAAKAAGGNHIHIWDPDRHGEPAPDGTRPLRRRRDIDLSAGTGAWQSRSAADDLVPLLLPPADAHLVYRALIAARDAGTDPAGNGTRSGFGRLAARLGPLLDSLHDPDPISADRQDGHGDREPRT